MMVKKVVKCVFYAAYTAGWILLVSVMLGGCASPTKPSSVDHNPPAGTSPEDEALKWFHLELARTSAGDVLAKTWGNHKLGLSEQYDDPDSATDIILRDLSCATASDPTNWWDWQARIGNAGGTNNSPTTQWGKINRGKCDGKLILEVLVITFHRKAANAIPNDLSRLVQHPSGIGHISESRKRFTVKVSDLPVRESW